MPKYSKWSKWLVAKAYDSGVSYEDFVEFAKKIGLDVPAGTYDAQRAYLRKRTPEEMGELPTSSISNLE